MSNSYVKYFQRKSPNRQNIKSIKTLEEKKTLLLYLVYFISDQKFKVLYANIVINYFIKKLYVIFYVRKPCIQKMNILCVSVISYAIFYGSVESTKQNLTFSFVLKPIFYPKFLKTSSVLDKRYLFILVAYSVCSTKLMNLICFPKYRLNLFIPNLYLICCWRYYKMQNKYTICFW